MKTPDIHPTAIVDPSAKIANTVKIGPFSIIGPDVEIDAETVLQSHVVVSGHTKIGKQNYIFPFCTLGEAPQDLKYANEPTRLEIGDRNRIRESCTIHRGTVQDNSITKIGDDNLFMVNTHIAHDCIIGSRNIFGNNAGIAGHVHIGDQVLIGGNSGVHQFCKIGSYSMMAGGTSLYKDLPAYILVAGNPASASGMNFEGMRRRNWSNTKITLFRTAYQIVYKKGLTLQQAIEKLSTEFLPEEQDLAIFIDSLKNSTRGITR